MKSIKEKAQEVKTELLLNRANIPEIYEAGANYVLGEVEKQLDEFTNYEDSLIVRRIIEQLKK